LYALAAAVDCTNTTNTTNQQKKKRVRHKAKILLADDNFDMREYVARLLSANYEVISVSNGPHPL
jgi:PleD family two-component response regulator